MKSSTTVKNEEKSKRADMPSAAPAHWQGHLTPRLLPCCVKEAKQSFDSELICRAAAREICDGLQQVVCSTSSALNRIEQIVQSSRTLRSVRIYLLVLL